MRNQLKVITNNTQQLSDLTKELNSGLSESKTNLTNITNECKKSFSSATFCDDIDTSSLAAEANFTNLPNVSQQLSNVQQVVDRDFEKSAQQV